MSEVPYAFIPWYAPSRERIVRFSGSPMAAQYARASFAAESTASEPPPAVKNTLASSMGTRSARRDASASAGAFVENSNVWNAARAAICAAAASASSRRP